jgi:hypothetical protein
MSTATKLDPAAAQRAANRKSAKAGRTVIFRVKRLRGRGQAHRAGKSSRCPCPRAQMSSPACSTSPPTR